MLKGGILIIVNKRYEEMNTVKIIAVTQPLIDNENGVRMTPDEFIAYCARVRTISRFREKF